MRVGPLAIAVALLVHIVYQQAEWPYLSSVGMSAELDVDAEAVLLCHFVRLMVEEKSRFVRIGTDSDMAVMTIQ